MSINHTKSSVRNRQAWSYASFLFFSLFTLVMLIGWGCQRKLNKDSKGRSQESSFQLQHLPAEKKVNVLLEGKLFTAYQYPDHIAKPILFPILTAKGTPLSRGYPLVPRPGERVDHPHHVGHWLNYGHVNGLDFWNNSAAISPEKKHRYGHIVHQKVEAIDQGKKAKLSIQALWKNSQEKVLLDESTTFIFSLYDDVRIIERVTRLTARDTVVTFQDNKEGMFGIRVARELEFPSQKPLLLVGKEGSPMAAKVVENTGVNGNYLSSTGQTGREVWGTRASWMKLHGQVAGEESSLVILDHPDNPGYPTYWHARDYGLFAANPLGQAIFSKGKEKLNFALAAGESAVFKYQILVHSGEILSAATIEKLAKQFAGS